MLKQRGLGKGFDTSSASAVFCLTCELEDASKRKEITFKEKIKDADNKQ